MYFGKFRHTQYRLPIELEVCAQLNKNDNVTNFLKERAVITGHIDTSASWVRFVYRVIL